MVNWDDVALDGTDFGNVSTVIAADSTVAVPRERYQARGLFLDRPIAVSGDGLAGHHGRAGVVLRLQRRERGRAAEPARAGRDVRRAGRPGQHAGAGGAVRGFGAVFLNVKQPLTTLEFFSAAGSLAALRRR